MSRLSTVVLVPEPHLDPENTIKIVKSAGYDLSKLHEDMWEGHPADVVGADKGDLKSKQFWVAKDTLLFVREIEPARGEPKKFDNIRVSDYRPLANAWVAVRVEVYSEDKLVFSEDYTEIQANVKLAPAVFDPQQFGATHWEKNLKVTRASRSCCTQIALPQ